MQKFYLLTVLIEYSAECITDAHKLYDSLETAKVAMAIEIEEATENFAHRAGQTVTDVDTCQEWRDEEGFGYTIGIEEVILNHQP